MKLYVAILNCLLDDYKELLSIWPTMEAAQQAAGESWDEVDTSIRDEYEPQVEELEAYDCWDALVEAENRHLSGN